MFITQHTRLGDVELRDRLWEFYRRAYANNPVLPFTELVNRSEFDEALLNSTNRVWVVWEDNRPMVMTLIATDITSTRWLNPDYFRQHHAERMRKGLVHYVMWVVVVVQAAKASSGVLSSRRVSPRVRRALPRLLDLG